MTSHRALTNFFYSSTISYPRCTKKSSIAADGSDCGSESWAFALFITWNLLSMVRDALLLSDLYSFDSKHIFVNMFTGKSSLVVHPSRANIFIQVSSWRTFLTSSRRRRVARNPLPENRCVHLRRSGLNLQILKLDISSAIDLSRSSESVDILLPTL